MLNLLTFILKYKIKNSSELIYLYIFFISSCLLIGLLSHGNSGPYLHAMLWVLTLFTWTISIGQFWQEDEEDGTLDQWRATGTPLEWVALAKLTVQGALVALPVALIAGFCLGALGMGTQTPWHTTAILALGGVQMMAIGMLAAAASTGLQKGTGIVGLIMLPLAVPSMIWGSNAIQGGDGANSAYMLLGGYALLSTALSCIASAACLRASD